VQAGVGGVGASVAGGAVTRQILGEKQTAGAAATDAAVGLITFGLGKGISSALSKSANGQMSAAIRELEKEAVNTAQKGAAAAATINGAEALEKQTLETSEKTTVQANNVSTGAAQAVLGRLSNDQLRRLPKAIAETLRKSKLLFENKSTIAAL